MRARVNHFTGNKLHLLHLNCYSKCCVSIFILFSLAYAKTWSGVKLWSGVVEWSGFLECFFWSQI